MKTRLTPARASGARQKGLPGLKEETTPIGDDHWRDGHQRWLVVGSLSVVEFPLESLVCPDGSIARRHHRLGGIADPIRLLGLSIDLPIVAVDRVALISQPSGRRTKALDAEPTDRLTRRDVVTRLKELQEPSRLANLYLSGQMILLRIRFNV